MGKALNSAGFHTPAQRLEILMTEVFGKYPGLDGPDHEKRYKYIMEGQVEAEWFTNLLMKNHQPGVMSGWVSALLRAQGEKRAQAAKAASQERPSVAATKPIPRPVVAGVTNQDRRATSLSKPITLTPVGPDPKAKIQAAKPVTPPVKQSPKMTMTFAQSHRRYKEINDKHKAAEDARLSAEIDRKNKIEINKREQREAAMFRHRLGLRRTDDGKLILNSSMSVCFSFSSNLKQRSQTDWEDGEAIKLLLDAAHGWNDQDGNLLKDVIDGTEQMDAAVKEAREHYKSRNIYREIMEDA
jgi:hypothetical protein